MTTCKQRSKEAKKQRSKEAKKYDYTILNDSIIKM